MDCLHRTLRQTKKTTENRMKDRIGIEHMGKHTSGIIKENLESNNEMSGKSTGDDHNLKDFIETRAFNKASRI